MVPGVIEGNIQESERRRCQDRGGGSSAHDTHRWRDNLASRHHTSQDTSTNFGHIWRRASDGAPDVTGLHDLDEYIQAQLVLCALQLTTCVLKEGGTFVAKIFRGRDIDLLYSQLGHLFERVVCAKPRALRGTSLEAFIVCIGYKPRPGWTPNIALSTEEFFQDAQIKPGNLEHFEMPEEERTVAEFVACGDLNSVDSDATYVGGIKSGLDPVQMPTAPPYKRALEMKRDNKRGK